MVIGRTKTQIFKALWYNKVQNRHHKRGTPNIAYWYPLDGWTSEGIVEAIMLDDEISIKRP